MSRIRLKKNRILRDFYIDITNRKKKTYIYIKTVLTWKSGKSHFFWWSSLRYRNFGGNRSSCRDSWGYSLCCSHRGNNGCCYDDKKEESYECLLKLKFSIYSYLKTDWYENDKEKQKHRYKFIGNVSGSCFAFKVGNFHSMKLKDICEEIIEWWWKINKSLELYCYCT